ncbi:MAG TPA: isoprenylcysteine carboxylmethyltransferase family protein [Phenylobacterium sp.]|uniref:methyltransferase family protein n=1 Tax=Phenylobacterium sp. TaxID=1871053 RepID=UPI002CEA0DE9|nr:isoprenylcysteine carboxylmethyltransferase family protein [Phenylobacterium sp.]HSV04703.1 isoprenylcysteine carboxylmethyltransferase family protein [Phenylobacterium sp.]
MSRPKLIALLIVEIVAMVAVMGAVLFVAAGSWRWPAGWRFIALFGALSLLLSLWLLWADPALLQERLKPPVQRGQGRWDRAFMGAAVLTFLAWLALIGLDAGRFGWSRAAGWAQGLGALLLIASYVGIGWVFRTNSFAAPVVRIQAEREQTVIDSGPYALIRHPMYAFALPIFLGAPLVAGSLWGLMAVPLAIIGIGWRAVREEQALASGLRGYADYARRVRWRFAPGVW